jgi:hypothetical protein
MGGSSFDRIEQEVRRQQQMMQDLADENHALRQQLAELRAGHGIVVEICGNRFTLGELPSHAPTFDGESGEMSPDLAAIPSVADAPTAAIAELSSFTSPENQDVIRQSESAIVASQESSKQNEAPTFLEEVMLDEFASAMTNPMAVWNGPVSKSEITEEEKKAALRRELMGSFLLE